MKFYTKKRSSPVVPIISLIDIFAILLIFFIVTTTFKEKKNLLSINLPSTKALAVATETSERLTIAVSEDEEVFLADQPLDAEALAPALVELKSSRPGVQLELKADETVPLGLLVQVWDAIVTAGFKIKDVPARIIVAPGGA